jgi:peptidoglycan/LPS O-acetylase OafA/YrhL
MPADNYWLKIGIQFFQPLAITAVICWIADMPTRCSWLKNATLQAIGRRSYGVYLWQQLFFAPPATYLFSEPLLLPVIGLIGTFACAFTSYALIERPLLRLGQRLAGVPVELRKPAAVRSA